MRYSTLTKCSARHPVSLQSKGQGCPIVTVYKGLELLKSSRLREAYIKSNIACLNEDNFGAVHTSDPRNLDPMDPCWEVKYQLQSLIKKIIAKQYKSQAPEQVILSEVQTPGNGEALIQEMPTRVAAAHVTGSNVKHSNPVGRSLIRYDGQKIVDWKSYKQPSFLNNIEINHGELVIKKSGFYYIYSQTYFRQRAEVKTEEGKGTQLVQRVYKITAYPDPILVMKNIKTSCWSKDAEYALNSIYQGGIYKFNENDRIFVTVSDISILDMDEKGTYFGAFLLF
uniref:Tumor necrosis factor ligand superfamily member 10 n=1 Tax=Leptobrachium leishanense TaxID=445787 RepID=A0A8C5QMS2_9ANUR